MVDLEDFERKIVGRKVKLFLLCSPHNPVGRVWSREELRQMGDICRRHGVYVVSDEIHCDFAFPDHPHTVFLDANPELADRAIVCTAPSKTFNLAGLQVSNIWIPDPQIRARFRKEMDRSGYSLVNGLGLVACRRPIPPAAVAGAVPGLSAGQSGLFAGLSGGAHPADQAGGAGGHLLCLAGLCGAGPVPAGSE